MSVMRSKELLNKADAVIILAGAGMSAGLGINTYWSGANSKYASELSRFGFTALQHATADTWRVNPDAQEAYFHEQYAEMKAAVEYSEDTVYDKLLQFLQRRSLPYFVFTSNADSAFFLKGFKGNRLNEVHGSYRYSQCLLAPVGHEVFPTDFDAGSHAVCPTCGSAVRPNVVFFNDPDVNPVLIAENSEAYLRFRHQTVESGMNVVALEIGAGGTIPTVRNQSVILNSNFHVPVIRINPNSENGVVDGIAGFMKKSEVAPFYEIPLTADEGLNLLLA